MKTFNGYLFAKLANIGTRSEGTDYYLQRPDYTEVRVVKQVNLWEEDPVMHPLLANKVEITGTLIEDEGIHYEQVDTPKC